jgi:hypothetical protein
MFDSIPKPRCPELKSSPTSRIQVKRLFTRK